MQPTSCPDLSVDSLGLSVRTRNAIKSVGCVTVADILRLDLNRPVRGLGKLAKEELLVKLDRAGFPHPSDAPPASEIDRIDRSLERIERRVDAVLAALSREIKAARHKLRRLGRGATIPK